MPSVYIPGVSRDAYIRSVQCLYIIPPPHTRDNFRIYLARLGRLRHSWSDMGQGSNGVRGREEEVFVLPQSGGKLLGFSLCPTFMSRHVPDSHN